MLRLALILWVIAATPAQSFAGEEAYSSRPKIEDVKSKTHPEIDHFWWRKLKSGLGQGAGFLLEAYPDHHYYVLGRDGELLYDLMKLVATPEELKRIHLINVSSKNKSSPHLKQYLEQEGISDLDLNRGKKIVIIDSGYNGSVIQEIRKNLKAGEQIKGALLASSGISLLPGLRSAWTPFDVEAGRRTSYASGIMPMSQLEQMHHFHDRSTALNKVEGRWEPISALGGSQDGKVSKTQALAYMEDLKMTATQPEFIQSIQKFRTNVAKIKAEIDVATPDELESLRQRVWTQKSSELEATFYDLVETKMRNDAPWGELHQKTLNRFHHLQSPSVIEPLTRHLEQFPQWKAVFESPKSAMQALVDRGQYSVIEEILNETRNVAVVDAAVSALSSGVPDRSRHELLKKLLAEGDLQFEESFIKQLGKIEKPKRFMEEIKILLSNGFTYSKRELLKLGGSKRITEITSFFMKNSESSLLQLLHVSPETLLFNRNLLDVPGFLPQVLAVIPEGRIESFRTKLRADSMLNATELEMLKQSEGLSAAERKKRFDAIAKKARKIELFRSWCGLKAIFKK